MRRWSREVVREELERFLDGEDEWPSYRAFVAAGHKGLRDAVTRFGGAERWAREFGVPYPDRRPGYAPRWSEAAVRVELAHYLEGKTEWPSRVAFERDGFKALRDAVNRTGGVQRWASEFGVERANLREGSRRVWDDALIEACVGALVRRVGRWPRTSEFAAAGLGSARAAMDVHGGIGLWKRRFGIGQQPIEAGNNGRRYWTEERVLGQLSEFCGDRDVWPTAREFEQAGKGGLYRAASRLGGVGRWQRSLGLRPPRPLGSSSSSDAR